MRAGTSPWLRPKFNSVDVVKMMVEGERKGEVKVKEWAPEAATAVLGPQCQKWVQSIRSRRRARFMPFSLCLTHLELQKWRALLRTLSHPLLLLFCYRRRS